MHRVWLSVDIKLPTAQSGGRAGAKRAGTAAAVADMKGLEEASEAAGTAA
jgi:hypothetical protein